MRDNRSEPVRVRDMFPNRRSVTTNHSGIGGNYVLRVPEPAQAVESRLITQPVAVGTTAPTIMFGMTGA